MNYNVYTQTIDAHGNIVDLSPAEKQRIQLELEQEATRLKLEHFLSERSKYIEAYRNYQAAVNYGEFQRVTTIDNFIEMLRNRSTTNLLTIGWSTKSIPASSNTAVGYVLICTLQLLIRHYLTEFKSD